MHLSVHLRGPQQRPPDLQKHLVDLYGDGFSPENGDWGVKGVHLGDEFCPRRLPSPADLDACLDMADGNGWPVTLLTPPMTDADLEACEGLLVRLESRLPGSEVVVNDWGVLMFVRSRYPGLEPVLGRLLDKGLKDPRLTGADDIRADVVNRCTFDSPFFRRRAAALGVASWERDLLPCEDPSAVPGRLHDGCAVYFPYGCITTGRVCWTATLGTGGRSDFQVSGSCSRPCSRLTFDLAHERVGRPVFQNGNTLFYRYAPSALRGLLEVARDRNVRLVYQGFAL